MQSFRDQRHGLRCFAGDFRCSRAAVSTVRHPALRSLVQSEVGLGRLSPLLSSLNARCSASCRTLPILASALGFLLDAARFRARFRLAAAVARLVPAAALHRADCASARHQQSRLSLSDYRCGRAVYLPAVRAGPAYRTRAEALRARCAATCGRASGRRNSRAINCALASPHQQRSGWACNAPVPIGTVQLTRGTSRGPHQKPASACFLRSLHRRGWFDPTLTCVIGGLGYEPVPDRTVSDNDGYLSAHWGMGSGKVRRQRVRISPIRRPLANVIGVAHNVAALPIAQVSQGWPQVEAVNDCTRWVRRT
ncbi:hypothetical protein MES5069_190104 [Mesorhizobium escarrei]|uniref:Transposase n=1 Tax=Mesorhizobium escarrei TaxID=666018 RepID=A0ABM9DNC0_9HYPH|nr:hypothetical protein MES5069_190104 [Mesorhizobium escarrei]